MNFDILTTFPGAFDSYFGISILARAIKKGFIKVTPYDLRQYALDKHKTVDDRPYGGGAGMVMKADVVFKALSAIKKRKVQSEKRKLKERIILLTPQGKVFSQKHAARLAKYDRLILVSGRYEGFDERIRKMVDEEISIGDYVLSGGELPAMVVIDSVARLIPGILGKDESLAWESFSKAKVNTPELRRLFGKAKKEIGSNLLEYPQYTRPESITMGSRKHKVPQVLLTGNHEKVFRWRQQEALKRTKIRRPDL